MSNILQIKVKPNARDSTLEAPLEGNIWTARLKSPPVDGRENKELVGLVAKHFGCGKSLIRIKSGANARIKLIQIDEN